MLSARSMFSAMRAAPRAPMPCRAPMSFVRPQQQSSFLGESMSSAAIVRPLSSRGALVVAAGFKTSMGCTISGKGSNKKRRNVSGYRARVETAAGRAILKARRAKGRKVLCTASVRSSGGKK
ncbi:plastid/chloroplast ribosomal protein L34 [Haematococcus lacustris]